MFLVAANLCFFQLPRIAVSLSCSHSAGVNTPRHDLSHAYIASLATKPAQKRRIEQVLLQRPFPAHPFYQDRGEVSCESQDSANECGTPPGESAAKTRPFQTGGQPKAC